MNGSCICQTSRAHPPALGLRLSGERALRNGILAVRRGEVAESGLTRTPGTRVDPKGSRGFESPPLRQRVPISGDPLIEWPKSAPQRAHMHKYGRGESALTASGEQFEAIISVGEFGAT